MSRSSPPQVAPGFHWAPAPWGHQLQSDALEWYPHGWTTRQLALRGTPEAESEAWAQVAAAGRVTPQEVVRLRQVHGAVVHHAVKDVEGGARPEADAAVSDDPRFLLAVQVADCVPLLMAKHLTGAVAAVHAGWRGTAAGVVQAALEAIGGPESVVAAIGPSIGPCCYRVGSELIDAFRLAGWSQEVSAWFEQRADGWHLDLWRANVDQLVQRGVGPDAVHVAGLCTVCHPAWFFSYRRDGGGTGRMAGYIRSV